MPDTQPPNAAQVLADFAAQGGAWPECFTDDDKAIMGAVDIITAELAQSFSVLAAAHRQRVFSALLARRNALN